MRDGPSPLGRSPDVVVIRGRCFGRVDRAPPPPDGARVTLVDAWGPGNSRSISGDETRGVRSSYGDRLTWVRWADEAMARWRRRVRRSVTRIGPGAANDTPAFLPGKRQAAGPASRALENPENLGW